MKSTKNYLKTLCIFFTLVAFTLTSIYIPESPAVAQEIPTLPAPGIMVHLSPEYSPAVLRGIRVYPNNPLRFDFILDKNDSQLSDEELKKESNILIKYFLASLTTPENDLWVNLSPYEKDRIIPNSLGLTEMGRDLLAQDYILKQITASLIYPEGEIGKRFWNKVYQEAEKRYGTTNVPINTYNKVWIVPENAIIYENVDSNIAYVVRSKLKVMLDQDYLSLKKHVVPGQSQETNQLGSQIIREIVLPVLAKEINENKNFDKLRQVYNSLILATWYKKKIKDSILSLVYADKDKVAGISIKDPKEKQRIYQQYLKAFKKGVYNYIKEDQDPITQEIIPRKYFSGGESFYQLGNVLKITKDTAMLSKVLKRNLILIGTSLALATGSLLYFSSHKRDHFEPPGHETMLIIGQQKESIDQYINQVGIPAGFMTYTSLKDLEGLYSPANRGAGTQDAQDLVSSYPNTVLEVGLNLVGQLDDIDSGKYGENIKRLGDWIKQTKHPVFLRIGYEFDNPANNYDPIKYRMAFRRIVDQLRYVEHVNNVAFVWHSNTYGHGSFKDFYPGDKYVDWVGMSYFEKGNEKWGKALFQFADERGKPKMICEASAWNTNTPEAKLTWFKNFFIFVHQENVQAVGYIDSNWDQLPQFQNDKYGDARIEDDQNILKYWRVQTRRGFLNSSPRLYREINFDPNKKTADQAMLFRRHAPRPVPHQEATQKTNFIQNIVKRPNFFFGFSVALFGIAAYLYGPVAAGLYFTPFVLTAFLAIFQDMVHANPGKVESKYYVDQFEEMPAGATYPASSVIIPVYHEPFEVLAKTIIQANKAVQYYNRRAGRNLANLVILDDGLQTLDQRDRDIRVRFYQRVGVSVIARPPHNVDGFKRTGFFKKASNLNYTFALDARLRRLLNDNHGSTQARLFQYLRTRANPETRYDRLFTLGDNILLGDFIMLIDNDSYTPEQSLVYSVHSLLRRPQAGYIQHVSTASNWNDNLLTRIYSVSTSVFWSIVLKARSLYAPTAVLGHNLVIRKQALEDVVNNSSEPGPFHEGRGADDLIPGINMRTGRHGYYGMLGNMPFQKGFQEGIPNVYSDLAGQMRRYGATGTGSIINPFSEWFKRGIFRPEFWAVVKDKNITIGEKFDTFMYAQHGLDNLFMMTMIVVAVAMVFLGVENALAIGFINGIIFATISQLFAVVYFQVKALKEHSFRRIIKTVLFSPPLFFCLSFQNAIGVIYDLMLGHAKSYGSTAIRKPSEQSKWRFIETFRSNWGQILTGIVVLGIVASLLFITVTPYTIINVLALIVYLFYFGTSLIITPFIFSGRNKNPVVEEPIDFDRIQETAQPHQDRAMTIEKKGGIDLTTANLNLQIESSGSLIKFHIDAAMFNELKNAPGFVPVINTFRPLTDMTILLGKPEEASKSVLN